MIPLLCKTSICGGGGGLSREKTAAVAYGGFQARRASLLHRNEQFRHVV